MRNVNSYVAWLEYKGTRIAVYQGIAESKEEFISMCEEKGYDIHDEDLAIEMEHANVKDEMGHSCKKGVSKDM